jgi:hypothetical protein
MSSRKPFIGRIKIKRIGKIGRLKVLRIGSEAETKS